MIAELKSYIGCLVLIAVSMVIIGGLGKLCIAAFDWVFGG